LAGLEQYPANFFCVAMLARAARIAGDKRANEKGSHAIKNCRCANRAQQSERLAMRRRSEVAGNWIGVLTR